MRFLAWHIAVADAAPALADHVAAYQHALRPLGFLDLIPRPWLHITIQGIGHAHTIAPDQLDTLTTAIRHNLATIPPPTLTFDKPRLHTEAVTIPPTDPTPLHTIRDAIRDAITTTHGPAEGTPPQHYRPHVSAAYVNTTTSPTPIHEALALLDIPPTAITLTHITLMELHRDHRMYEWHALSIAPIGPLEHP